MVNAFTDKGESFRKRLFLRLLLYSFHQILIVEQGLCIAPQHAIQ